MVPLVKVANETRRGTIQIKSFFILVAISLHANRKIAIAWPYYSMFMLGIPSAFFE